MIQWEKMLEDSKIFHNPLNNLALKPYLFFEILSKNNHSYFSLRCLLFNLVMSHLITKSFHFFGKNQKILFRTPIGGLVVNLGGLRRCYAGPWRRYCCRILAARNSSLRIQTYPILSLQLLGIVKKSRFQIFRFFSKYSIISFVYRFSKFWKNIFEKK